SRANSNGPRGFFFGPGFGTCTIGEPSTRGSCVAGCAWAGAGGGACGGAGAGGWGGAGGGGAGGGGEGGSGGGRWGGRGGRGWRVADGAGAEAGTEEETSGAV